MIQFLQVFEAVLPEARFLGQVEAAVKSPEAVRHCLLGCDMFDD
jgi:hypothetical protein